MDEKIERLKDLVALTQKEFSKENILTLVPEYISKKFIAYCSMEEDINLAYQYLNLLEESDDLIRSSLTYAFISIYGKCFSDASKCKYPKLESNDIFKNEKVFLKTHCYLINLRHQFIAHRGYTESEVGLAFIVTPKTGDVNSQVIFRGFKRTTFSDDKIDEIKKLLDFLLTKLSPKVQKSGQKINDFFSNNHISTFLPR